MFLRFLLAFGVGWIARMIEESLTATGWGGPMTILTGWIIIVFLSGFFALAAVFIGQLLSFPAVVAVWTRAGFWTLLLAIPPALVLAFSAKLGLRTIDPISNYSLMDLWPNSLCHFFIIFPFANLAVKSKVKRDIPPPLPITELGNR